MMNERLKRLEVLTEELSNSIDNPTHPHQVFRCMCNFFDTLNVCVAIVREDKTVIFLNNRLIERLKKCTNIDTSDLIFKKCSGINNKCPLQNHCDNIWSDKSKINIFNDIKSPWSGEIFDVVILPLRVNGVCAIIEIWSSKNGCE